MKSSLVSREVIADSVELSMRGHCYDALVGLAGCDKSLPGLMMAMLRLNVPSVFMYGGSILPGRFKGHDVTIGDVFEAVGSHNVGSLSDAELHELECVACPSAGSCGGLFTANTMACVSEAIGLALPGSAGAPAPYDSRDAYAEASGQTVMELLRRNLRPRDIVTREAVENAAMVATAAGGSTNAGLHIPAIAHEAGIEFTLHDFGEIFEADPLYRRSEAWWPLCDEGFARRRRRAGADEGVARRRLPARRLHDRDRQDGRRKPARRGVSDRAGCRDADLAAIGGDRRPCRPQRQSRTAGRPGKGRRHEDRASLYRAGAVLRLRGGCLCRGG